MPQTPAAHATAVTYQVASGQAVGCGNSAPSAPTAEFIGVPTSGTVPFTTTFTNQSTGTYSAQAWNFGDGGTSTSANPTHAYTAAGTYTVTLTLTWAGGTVTRTRTAYVSASASSAANTATLYLPSTGTTGSPTTGSVALNGTAPAAGSITISGGAGATVVPGTLSWTSGEAGTAKTFTVQYAADGAHSVSITSGIAGVAVAGPPASHTTSATGSTITSVVLRGGSTGTQPFAIGHAFKQGDMAAGAALSGLQLNVLTAWPDGSAKTAIVAGYAAITSGTDKTVALASGAAASGAAITTAALAAVTAQHDCGTFGAVNWSSGDWGTPFVTVCTGPVMSSWVYRKAVGSDAHLVAWLEVRAYANGEIQVLPWVENGYIAVASPTNKSATYAFSLNGVVKCSGVAIDLKHHQRTPLINGTSLWYWAGSDPGIVPIHDSAYLQSTELVPSYYSSLSAGDAKVTALPSTYAPLQQGSFTYDTDAMTSTGYQAPIGLLPQHDVLHLIAADADRASTFKAVVRNGFSAGRYGIHYRDEGTNKPLRFQDHPNRVIADSAGFASNGTSTTGSRTPTPTGGNPPIWDTAHSPSVGYMAALLTGFRYFIEEAQFAATCNYLGNGDNSSLRNGSQGLTQTAVDAWQTRAAAWDWRAHAQALTLTPSTDQIYTDLVNRAHSNVDHFHGRYVAQTNNAFGIILPGETYSASISRVAIWQQDFHTAAWGYSKCLGLPLDSTRTTKLADFFTWKAQSIIGRLGTSGAFPFENANRYTIELGTSLSTSGYTAGTGPWPASWTAIYSTTTPLATSPDNPLATAGGNVLATEYDSTSASKGQWGELQMAIAYAVRHGVSGASAAYNRMIGATNWASMLTSQWSASYPVMGVKPYTDPVGTPAWASAVAVGQIKAVGATGAGGSAVNAFSGWAYRPDTNEIFIAAAGGHLDSFDNRVVSCDLMASSLAWTTRKASTGSGSVTDNAYQADGTPSSRHNYQETRWVAAQNRIMLFGCYAPYGPGVTTPAVVDGFNPTTNTWDAAGTWTGMTAGYYGRTQEGNGDVWAMLNVSTRKFTASTGVWSDPGTTLASNWVRFPWAYSGSYLFGLCWGDGQGFNSGVSALKHVSNVQTTVTFNASSAYTQFQADTPQYAGMDYCTTDGKFYFYDGRGSAAGRIFTVTPNGGTTWDMGTFTAGSGSDTPAATVSAGINNRWTFITVGTAKGFLFMPSSSAGLYFLRTE